MTTTRLLRFLLGSVLYLLLAINASSQYTGLSLSGHEVPLDKRSGLNLTPEKPIPIEADQTLSFEFYFEPGRASHFGYIFRAIIDHRNIDLIYTPEADVGNKFHLVTGEEISSISFQYPLDDLIIDWIPVEFEIKKSANKIRLKIGEKEFEDSYDYKKGKSDLYLFFGAHRFDRFSSTDLPNMNLRNIRISKNGQLRYSWPLDQHQGTLAYEVIRSFHGSIENPHWIQEGYASWRLLDEFSLPGRIRYVFNRDTRQMQMLHEDSLYCYSLATRKLNAFYQDLDVAPDSRHNLIYDNQKCEILVYTSIVETVFWHHNRIIIPEENRLYTFGGYGALTYSNEVLSYNAEEDQWDTIHYSGTFHPRYLAGAAYNPSDNRVYIIGGYGSKTGKQSISPGYYYDLLAYSIDDQSFETLHEFSEDLGGFCFSNSLQIDTATNTMYGLKFSKYETTPEVQAIAVSLDDYSITPVGNAFSFEFLDVNSNLDLFFDPLSNSLIAFTAYLNEDQTEVRLYQIDYPPVVLQEPVTVEPSNPIKLYVTILGSVLALLVILAIFFLRRRKRKGLHIGRSLSAATTAEFLEIQDAGDASPKPGSIVIFGGFQVIDRNGKDITNSFTPLLKELFLYIMLSSLRHLKGVSSKTLDELFWFGKSEVSARNNRAVNIGKLKTILEGVGDCQISKETGYWKFTFDAARVYIDFFEFLELLRTGKIKTKEGIYNLLRIIQTGPAMQNIHADWLDTYKSEISNEIIDNILEFIYNDGKDAEADFIIHLADSIFFFDLVNEEAMIIKCQTLARLGKHSLANAAYEKFVKDYHNLYDENYAKSFNQVLSTEH